MSAASTSSECARILARLKASTSFFTLLLIGSTWRLWFRASDFPAIPVLTALNDVPVLVERALSAVLIGGLSVWLWVTLRASRNGAYKRDAPASAFPADTHRTHSLARRACIETLAGLVIGVSAIALILRNQHALQPWLYHLLVLLPAFLLSSDRGVAEIVRFRTERGVDDDRSEVSRLRLRTGDHSRLALRLIFLLTASIYLWSGWSRLDASFATSFGPQFIEALLRPLGLSLRFLTEAQRESVALSLPVGEMLIGMLLLIPRTRRLAMALAIGMHLLLMLAVGPWGMNHEAGVLIWNAAFIAQHGLMLMSGVDRRGLQATLGLESPSPPAPLPGVPGRGEPDKDLRLHLRKWFAIVVTVLACLAPLGRPAGWCDNWPAWAVYSASTERLTVFVRAPLADRLPESLRAHLRPQAGGWSRLRIDQWSLAALHAPIYPQVRFQLAVLRSALEGHINGSHDLEHIAVWKDSEANRWTGERTRSAVRVESP